ncbi:MAG: aldo/keto reductase [Chloroflexota bacterium]|nr:aldo/keto reductase [Chloroflexota bacterium]
MAEVTARRRLGRSAVEVTELGFGGASIGELFVRVSEADAAATLAAAWDAGVRYFDTAPWYGRGLSELRTGAALRDQPRSAYTLSTKVGRWLRPSAAADFDGAPWLGGLPNEVVFDYTYDGIMRSVEGSRLRLGVTRFDAAYIHDLDRLYFDRPTMDAHFRDLASSGWRALEELRASDQIGAIGAGINDLGLMPRFLDIGDIDAFLVAMPYTLLDQEVLEVEFPACVERGVGFVIGAVYASGILAKGPVAGAKYAYADPSVEVMEKTRRIAAVCARHGVPLAAAALQFPLGHPSVASVIPGASSPGQQARNVEAFQTVIPDELWAELKHERLLHADAPVPRVGARSSLPAGSGAPA